MTNTRHLLIATLLLVLSQARDVRRMGRAKHMFWFKVAENEELACRNVKEAEVEIVEGPPASGCTLDEERFCMCGKLGPVARNNWTFFCGRCREQPQFTFKVDLGRFKKKNKKRRKHNHENTRH